MPRTRPMPGTRLTRVTLDDVDDDDRRRGQEQVEQRRGQQPLPGEAHQLVDPDPGQRAAHPHEDEHEDERLEQEPDEAGDPVEAEVADPEQQADRDDVEHDEAEHERLPGRPRAVRRARTAAAKNSVNTDRRRPRSGAAGRCPGPPGSSAERDVRERSNGAFHAPKKSVTMSAEMMNTFTYSAKNRKPKRMPEYSVAKPATISESASVRSNGVRLASAVAAMKKISAPSGWRNTNQSQNQPDCWIAIWLRLIVPASRIRPTTRERQRDLVADDLGRGAQPAQQRVLVEARPAGHQQADDGHAADGEQVQQADVEVLADEPGPERDDEERHHRGQEHDDRRPGEHERCRRRSG